jgi:hypothetical protein
MAKLEAENADLSRQLETQSGILESYRNSVIAALEANDDE